MSSNNTDFTSAADTQITEGMRSLPILMNRWTVMAKMQQNVNDPRVLCRLIEGLIDVLDLGKQ